MQLYLPRFCMSQIFSRFVKPVPPKNVNQKKRALQLAIKEKQQQLEQSGLLDENLKQERFTHTTNYNFETYLKYTKLVKAEKDKEVQVIQPKQKRVAIYDRPKFDLSLTDYYVWTTFHDPYYKPDEYSEIVVCKIYLSPKGLIHAFGMGMDPWRNKLATKEFDFEDSNLDKFCLYDAKQTTKYWGPNRSEQFYNKQQYLKPIYRKQRWPTFEEFWTQEEKAPFRVNCTRYGDFRKFKEWIQQEIERCSKLPSFEERVLKKYGQPEFYADYSKSYQCKTEPAVYKYTREYFLEKGQKLDQSNVLNIPLQPPEHLGEEYRVSIGLSSYSYQINDNNIKQITKNSPKQSKQSGVNKKIVKEPKPEANLRILHMTEEQYQEKIENLEQRIAELQGPDNKTKRKRLYHELAQLKKNVKLIDPNVIEEKKQKDLERRIQKKLQSFNISFQFNIIQLSVSKKQQTVEEVQKEKKKLKMKEKDKVCLVCKKIGHTAQHCRENVQPTTDVICYNCGSQKHTLKDCQKPKSGSLKFATCFVCKEAGHISRDCPKNPKGLYAYGGGCYICSSTHHTQANCPQNPKNRIISQQQQKQQDDYMSD